MKGWTWARILAVIGLLATLPLGVGAAPAPVDAAAIYRQWIDAINQGDIDAVMDLFADDAIYDYGFTCDARDCRGKENIQDEIAAMISGHARFIPTHVAIDTYTTGDWRQTAISGWNEVRTDGYREAGLERFIGVVTLGLRGDKIASATYLGDRTDAATKQYLDQRPAAARRQNTPTPTDYGRFVDVHGHKMYLECMGAGSPTVILEGGAGYGTASQKLWNGFNRPVSDNTVQPDIARATRVCTYDRAGFGLSEQSPNLPHTLQTYVDDLHDLLHTAGIDGPYVLEGISLGVQMVRLYASEHPDEVAGMAFLDDGLLERGDRFDALIAETMPPDYVQRRQENIRAARAKDAGPQGTGGGFDMDASLAQLRAMGPLPAVPLVALVAAIPPNPADYTQGFPYARWQQLDLDQKAELARSVPNSALIVVDNSRHGMNNDVPHLIAASILDVVAAAQGHTPLTGR